MELICPPLPSPEGKQTNCWRLATTLYIVQAVAGIFTGLGNSATAVNGIINGLLQVLFMVAYWYHLQYVVIDVSGDMIEIKGGPCRWCEPQVKAGSPLKWISPYFCTSTQIRKDEVVAIQKIVRGCTPQIIPQFICMPLIWCCCRKSYGAYVFPFCLCLNVNIAGCCEGDSDSTQMIEIIINRKKWNLNIWTLCYYDKVVVAYKDEAVLDTLRSNGYQVQDGPVAAQPTATGGAAAPTDTGAPGA